MKTKIVEVSPFMMVKPMESDSYLRLTFQTKDGDKDLTITGTKEEICKALGIADNECESYNFKSLMNQSVEVKTKDNFIYEFVGIL